VAPVRMGEAQETCQSGRTVGQSENCDRCRYVRRDGVRRWISGRPQPGIRWRCGCGGGLGERRDGPPERRCARIKTDRGARPHHDTQSVHRRAVRTSGAADRKFAGLRARARAPAGRVKNRFGFALGLMRNRGRMAGACERRRRNSCTDACIGDRKDVSWTDGQDAWRGTRKRRSGMKERLRRTTFAARCRQHEEVDRKSWKPKRPTWTLIDRL
jgi:hypothetical protein